MDRTYDCLEVELNIITDHINMEGILEIKIKYTNGEQSQHPIGLIKNENPHKVVNYALSNNFGPLSNGTYHRWGRLFINSLRLTFCRLRRTIFVGFELTIFTLVLEKKRRYRCYAHYRRDNYGRLPKAPDRTNISFKFGLEIPQNLSNMLRIDEAAGNNLWKEGTEKEVAELIYQQYLSLKSLNFKPNKEYRYCRLYMVYNVKPDLTYRKTYI